MCSRCTVCCLLERLRGRSNEDWENYHKGVDERIEDAEEPDRGRHETRSLD